MIETELRDAFARAETLVPDGAWLVPAIAGATRRRVRRRRWAQAGCAALVVLLAIAAPTLGRVWLERPQQADLLPGPVGADLSGPLNILVAGLDQRMVADGAEIARADTIVLAHVPADRSAVYLLVIPRDLEVDLDGRRAKINASYTVGGFGLLSQVVSDVTGVPIDVGAALRLDGLAPLVEELGGIRICVDTATTSLHTGRSYPVGCYAMDGDETLDYVRQRNYPDGSWGRDRHVAQVAAALVAQTRPALADAADLLRLSHSAGPALTVDLGGSSLVDLVWTVRGATDHVVGLTIPTRVTDTHNLEIDPGAAGLFEALQADDLGEWAAANPAAVVPLTG